VHRGEPFDDKSLVTQSAHEGGVVGCPACRGAEAAHDGDEAVDGGRVLVCRAVQSILAGALNESIEPAFARSLGVSGRHLRRLFLQNVGTTPAALASTARLDVALRLLRASDMKISDIAFVVGYGSVRQFNRAMAVAFGVTPRALRGRPAGELPHPGEGLSLRLPVPRGYDWGHVLRLIQRSTSPGVECIDGATYRRVVVTGASDVGLVEVHHSSGEHLLVRLQLPSLALVVHIVDRIRSTLGLDSTQSTAVSAGTAVKQGDAPSSPEAAVRPVSEWTAFEAAVKAVVGVPDQDCGKERLAQLVHTFGRPVMSVRFGIWRQFPTAYDLSKVGVRYLGQPMAIAVPLFGLATAVSEGSLPISGGLPASVRLRSLRSIDGITDEMIQRFAWLMGGTNWTRAITSDAGQKPAHTLPPTAVLSY
jgi:AraC family transcriptional regulator, regulatory protein of adaptative response / DNA-3-methyladenine glycosylase II